MSDEEARFFCTVTPSYYINYSRELAEATKDGKLPSVEEHQRNMAKYATIAAGPGKK